VVILIKRCIEINKPVFGICLGCQLIAYTLGCEIRPSGKLNVGYDTKILGFDHLFRCHYDYIIPNEKIHVLDYFDSMLYAFTYHKLFGIQCHPDIPPEYVTKYQSNPIINKLAEENHILIDQHNRELVTYILNELRKN